MPAAKFSIAEFSPLQDWAVNPLWRSIQFRWYWIPLSTFLFAALGFVFLRYKTPHYHIAASLLVQDNSRGSDFRETALLEELGLPDATSSVENEIEILKSRTLLNRVVNDLHLTTRYFATGHLKTTEIYEKKTFRRSFPETAVRQAGNISH